ncbi:galactose mutarotase-like [Zingiber officinale]|nr:galactose mutarotase-like [Zingiber officinale]
MHVNISTWGATIQSIRVPDSKGKLADVVLGFDGIGPYITDNNYFGGIVGRVANKIGNAEFTLNGTTYHLFRNDGNDSFHGGNRGFNKVIWEVAEDRRYNVSVPFITFHYRSSDGEQGFPGAVDVFVTYEMYEENELSVHMIATPVDKPTPINLAQHICWNLGGHDSGSVLHHKLQISASRMTQVDDRSLPTGKIVPVHGTPFDFRSPTEVGSRISKLLAQQPDVGGYDVNYVLDRKFEGTYKMAEVEDRRSGRVLEICSDAPAMRLETGNLLDHVRGKGGHYYEKHSGLCLATQGFPDAVNHPNFPSQVYSPGQTYHHDLLYRFTAKI